MNVQFHAKIFIFSYFYFFITNCIHFTNPNITGEISLATKWCRCCFMWKAVGSALRANFLLRVFASSFVGILFVVDLLLKCMTSCWTVCSKCVWQQPDNYDQETCGLAQILNKDLTKRPYDHLKWNLIILRRLYLYFE